MLATMLLVSMLAHPVNGYDPAKDRQPDRGTSEPDMLVMAPTYFLPVYPPRLPDARHCQPGESQSCELGCGVAGVKSCAVGTIEGKMTVLCVCNMRVNLNLYVSNATCGGDGA
jgi:hypothetical protein